MRRHGDQVLALVVVYQYVQRSKVEVSPRLVIDAVAGFIDLATRSLVSLTLPLAVADQGRSRANLLENKMEPEPSNLLKKRSRWSHSTSEYLQRGSHFQELVKLGLEEDVEEYWRTTHIHVDVLCSSTSRGPWWCVCTPWSYQCVASHQYRATSCSGTWGATISKRWIATFDQPSSIDLIRDKRWIDTFDQLLIFQLSKADPGGRSPTTMRRAHSKIGCRETLQISCH